MVQIEFMDKKEIFVPVCASFLCVTEKKEDASDSAKEWFSIRDHPFSLSIFYCEKIYFK